MGTLHKFRHLRWGPPRKLSVPYFLRERPDYFAGVRRMIGLIALAAMMLAASALLFAT
jgi:hypothetical protein